MAYKQENRPAYAGQISKVGESLARATGEQNVGATAVVAGRFVALANPHGIRELSAITDSLAGVVVKSQLQTVYQPQDYLSVGKIGHGDGIWVELEGDAERGSPVHVRAVAAKDKPVGTVSAEPIVDNTDTKNPVTQSIKTDLVVIKVAGGLAEVTRKE